VNTGRYVGKKNLEDTILTINLQAAKEIAKQLRLRNIGGIIVIDFIDMTTSENRVKVYEDFVAALSTDPVRTRVLPMSEMGLIELTRKRVRHSLPSIVSQDCVHCKGRGWTSSAYEVGRRVVCHVESTVAKQVGALRLKVRAHPQTVQALKTEHSVALERLETRTGAQITLQPAKEFHVEQYEVTSA
jgi:ribonuclease G